MLDVIRESAKGWLAKVILVLITVPFALWGIDSYLHDAGGNIAIAKIGGSSVTVQEYGNEMQNLRARLQAQGKMDPALLEDPAIKESVLDRLIANHLYSAEAKDANFAISDEQLSKYIIGIDEFHENGQFSQQRYDLLLSQNRKTPSQFEATMRNELLTQQVRDGFATLAVSPQAVTENALKINHQAREVSVASIKTTDFLSQVKVEPAEVQAYYDQHKDKFRIPEQVKLEFVMLSANALIAGLQVNDDEAKKFYAENADKFQGDERRHASHILISFGVSATPQAKLDAKKKAEEVLAEVKAHPDQFAEFARKYSKDPVSAEKGGDLGTFKRGELAKPVEDAAFALRPGEISNLVESEFGYHIVKLDDITGQAQTFDSVRPQIRAELLYQKALAKFSEQAENFNNTVYEQSSSLQPAADAFGLKVQQTGYLSRADVGKFFKNDKLVDAVFSDEVLKDKRNTEAIEVAPNTLAAARVLEYKPSTPRTFDEVKAGIEDYLKVEKASKLAVAKGESVVASLRQGKNVDGLDWIPPVVVNRKNAQGLTDLAMSQVFKVNTATLPGYSGAVDSNKGYLLVKVSRVDNLLESSAAERTAAENELQTALAEEYVSAYTQSLRTKNKVTVKRELLNSGTDNQ